MKLETSPRPLCGAETKTLQMRPSQTQLEVVTNWRTFQKPPRNHKSNQLSCTKMALAPKPCIRMTWETTQINRLVSGFDLAPWESKSEMVTNRRIFQKLTTTPKRAQNLKNWLFEALNVLRESGTRVFSSYHTLIDRI